VRLGRRVIVVERQRAGGVMDGWTSKDSVTNADGMVAGAVASGQRRSWNGWNQQAD
jgi:hypothetical protein